MEIATFQCDHLVTIDVKKVHHKLNSISNVIRIFAVDFRYCHNFSVSVPEILTNIQYVIFAILVALAPVFKKEGNLFAKENSRACIADCLGLFNSKERGKFNLKRVS